MSSSLLNKLISKDLVRGLPKMKFAENKICEACVKGKQIRSSFKPKNQVTSSRTLELLHMDVWTLKGSKQKWQELHFGDC